ncbi:LRRK2 [Mytilus edulis]|uniref:LRRK2 n=1 Tax=Mytilus edulis TaxID=6550 RepID=A0A8S3RHA7_MYTED|nr:LRRK2 [Mytilus edulis]
MKLQQSKVNMCLKDVEISLQNVFGALDSGSKYEFQHVLKPDLKDLSKCLCYEKDRMIFSSVTEALLQQVKIENNDIVVEKQHNGIKVYDMALMKNGKVLLSMKSSKLNIWDFEGKLGLFQSFKSFDTYGICVGKENEIFEWPFIFECCKRT